MSVYETMTAEQRTERARTAAKARWAGARRGLDAHVAAVVQRASELTTEQRAQLAAVLPHGRMTFSGGDAR